MRSARIGGLNSNFLEGAPTKGTVDTILEHPNETTEDPIKNGDKLTNQTCTACSVMLSEDEVTINQRFIDQSLADPNAQVDLT